ncbi:hypothetical protein [Halomonas sp. 18071143]|uniref:hypothetical protein n=1 Tax=Halomonas sp. 18071143 TaxID=2855441 RepID=UPI001C47874F|nr:hypothetical protein [Halomonas sp. 18071143]
MLSLTSSTVLAVLRGIMSRHGITHSEMLPSAGTAERDSLVQAVTRFFGLSDGELLSPTCITLEEWATALSEQGDFSHLQLFDTAIGGAFSHQLQRQHRYEAAFLQQEAIALQTLLTVDTQPQRSLVSWLSKQTAPGFVLGALLPQQAGWQPRSLFDHANALWELNAGDIMVTSEDRWRQLAQRLPSLPMSITAVSTAPLDKKTYRALLAKGVAHIIELHCQPGLGVLAARRSQNAPFELLPHWHPTESDNFLLKLIKGGAPEEVKLAQPLRWVGARHFRPQENVWTDTVQVDRAALRASPAWQPVAERHQQGSSAA